MATPKLATNQSPLSLGFPNSKDKLLPYSEALTQIVILGGKTLYLLLLFSLLVLSFAVWIWIASFRNGWSLLDWFLSTEREQRTSEQFAYGLFYGLIVIITSPVLLFSDWSQKQLQCWLPQWMQPGNIPAREIIENRLGIQLDENFPFLKEPKP
ncbi:MAG: hypothetical protein AAGH78_17480 [Cyanobacteria bacterium P01_H01_bin.58]